MSIGFRRPRTAVSKFLVGVVALRGMISRIGDDTRECCSQGQEYEGLNESDQQLIEVKRNQDDKAKIRRHLVHRIEEKFAAENIAEKAEGEGDGANDENGKNFDPANEEENNDESDVGGYIGEFGLGSKDVNQGTPKTAMAKAPVEKHKKEDSGISGGKIDIGIGAAKERLGYLKMTVGGHMTVTDGSDTWDEGQDVLEKDEGEEAAEKPETALHGFATSQAFDKIAQELDKPFDEILHASWNKFRGTHGNLDDSDKDDDGNDFGDHRIGDCEPFNGEKFDRSGRQAFGGHFIGK